MTTRLQTSIGIEDIISAVKHTDRYIQGIIDISDSIIHVLDTNGNKWYGKVTSITQKKLFLMVYERSKRGHLKDNIYVLLSMHHDMIERITLYNHRDKGKKIGTRVYKEIRKIFTGSIPFSSEDEKWKWRNNDEGKI